MRPRCPLIAAFAATLAFPPAARGQHAASAVMDAAPPSPRWGAGALLWSIQPSPAPGAAQAIGKTTSGCLIGAEKLPTFGLGYWVRRPGRPTHFGHPDTIDYVRQLGLRLHAAGAGPVVIGDLSQPRGGPYPLGHLSHQTGLDIDVGYPPTALPPPVPGRARISGSDLVADPRVDWRQIMQVVSLAAADQRVDRVLVNAAMKRFLCQSFPEQRPALAKVRAWWGHSDHLHVRLRCPPDSPACAANDSPPFPDGCGAVLDWWQSPESGQAWLSFRRQRRALRAIERPLQCEAVVQRRLPVPRRAAQRPRLSTFSAPVAAPALWR